MSKDKPLWIDGCPYCEAFTKLNIKKLYYPHTIDEVKKSEFIIIDCPKKHQPLLIYRDHTPHVLSESWGRMLYVARKEFGQNIKLHISSEFIIDHFCAYIVK